MVFSNAYLFLHLQNILFVGDYLPRKNETDSLTGSQALQSGSQAKLQ